MCSKSMKTEAVFTKTEMENKWNFDFLQTMRCDQKVPRLKLYLLWQKQSMKYKFSSK